MRKEMPIGIFDSGVGGLTVASAIAGELPHERIFYFGDMARCPYGNRTPQEVREFSFQIMEYLVSLGVKMAVVACNTATATALPELRQRFDIPIVGVVQPGARAAVAGNPGGKIGVIGTSVTIASGAYEQAIRGLSAQADVYSLACPAFVPLVEKGLWASPDVLQVVEESLQPLVAADISSLILGCTHYPLLQDVIAQVMGTDVKLISSAAETATEVRHILQEANLLSQKREGQNRYFTTGDGTRMKEVLRTWMDIPAATLDVSPIAVDVLVTTGS